MYYVEYQPGIHPDTKAFPWALCIEGEGVIDRFADKDEAEQLADEYNRGQA